MGIKSTNPASSTVALRCRLYPPISPPAPSRSHGCPHTDKNASLPVCYCRRSRAADQKNRRSTLSPNTQHQSSHGLLSPAHTTNEPACTTAQRARETPTSTLLGKTNPPRPNHASTLARVSTTVRTSIVGGGGGCRALVYLHLGPLSSSLRVCVLELRRVFDLDVDALWNARLHEVSHASQDLPEQPEIFGLLSTGCKRALPTIQR